MNSVLLRPLPKKLMSLVVNDATGAAVIIPAPGAGMSLFIWGFLLTTPSSQTLTFKSGSVSLTGPMTITGLLSQLPVSEQAYPVFETGENETFNIALGSAVQLSGIVYYTIHTIR